MRELTASTRRLNAQVMNALREKGLLGGPIDPGVRTSSPSLAPDVLRNALPPDVALVDLILYDASRPTPTGKGKRVAERRLAAFVIRLGKPIQFLDMGSFAPIGEALEGWCRLVRRGGNGQGEAGRQLRRLLWAPLEKHLGGARVVLVSPDGPLARLSFAALPGNQPGRYLLEEVAVAVLPVPQMLPEFLFRASIINAPSGLLLVGDVDFDSAAPGGNAAFAATAERGTRGAELHWGRLDGTAKEAEAVKAFWRQFAGQPAMSELRGSAATRAAVLQEIPRHPYIHIATHGFFTPAGEASALAPAAARTGVDGPAPGSRHPGLLSGLVLAGANRPPRAGQDDGILTALEVPQLELGANTELVVLSACETGLGKEAAGEGVLGLQRLPTGGGAQRGGQPVAGARRGHAPAHGALLPQPVGQEDEQDGGACASAVVDAEARQQAGRGGARHGASR